VGGQEVEHWGNDGLEIGSTWWGGGGGGGGKK